MKRRAHHTKRKSRLYLGLLSTVCVSPCLYATDDNFTNFNLPPIYNSDPFPYQISENNRSELSSLRFNDFPDLNTSNTDRNFESLSLRNKKKEFENSGYPLDSNPSFPNEEFRINTLEYSLNSYSNEIIESSPIISSNQSEIEDYSNNIDSIDIPQKRKAEANSNLSNEEYDDSFDEGYGEQFFQPPLPLTYRHPSRR